MFSAVRQYRRGGGSSGPNKVSQTQDIYWSQTICFMRTLTILRQHSMADRLHLLTRNIRMNVLILTISFWAYELEGMCINSKDSQYIFVGTSNHFWACLDT